MLLLSNAKLESIFDTRVAEFRGSNAELDKTSMSVEISRSICLQAFEPFRRTSRKSS